MKLEINKSYDGYWISDKRTKDINYYLWHDGTLSPCCIGNNRYVDDGWYKTKEEAQKVLESWLPQEAWITQKQVEEAAKTSGEAALKCSLNHWKQIVLHLDAYKTASRSVVDITAHFCALCKRHFNEQNCPLTPQCRGKHCSPEWHNFFNEDKLKNAVAMFNRLQTTYNKLYGGKMEVDNKSRLEQVRKDIKLLQEEEKKIQDEIKKQYEVKHGDLLYYKSGREKPLVVIKVGSVLKAFYKDGLKSSIEPETLLQQCGYKKIGNVYDRKN